MCNICSRELKRLCAACKHGSTAYDDVLSFFFAVKSHHLTNQISDILSNIARLSHSEYPLPFCFSWEMAVMPLPPLLRCTPNPSTPILHETGLQWETYRNCQKRFIELLRDCIWLVVVGSGCTIRKRESIFRCKRS